MTQDNANSVTVSGEPLVSAARFNIKPLMAAYMTCAMAMMAFASLTGPIDRAIAAFGHRQAGAAVTVGGVLWILLSRPRGALSDRRGRRTVLLAKVGGFMLACRAMRILLIVSLRALPAAGPVFAGLLVSREAVDAFFAAIPADGQAPVANHVAPGERRRHGLALRGRWRWIGRGAGARCRAGPDGGVLCHRSAAVGA